MPKRLLYVTQYYSSPGQPGGLRHYAHARHLAEKGWDITIVTSYVKNSLRVIPPEYKGRRIVKEKQDSIDIYKVYASPNYDSDFISRMRNYLTFMFYAILAGLRTPSADVVLASSPSLFTGVAGYLLSRVKRAAFVLEVRDLWPQAAVTMGVLRSRFVIRLAEWLARFLYRRADRIVVVTRGIRDGIIADGIPASKIELITNGVDGEFFGPASEQQTFALRRDLGWEGKFIALYVGTLARSDGLETIVNTAERLQRTQKDVHFVFLGAGEAKLGLQRLANELQLQNTTFLPPQPKENVPQYIQAADVCLLPNKAHSFFGMVLPNKLFDYLAAGAPVIASVPKGETQELLETADAGVVVEPEDPDALANALITLRQRPETQESLGQNGRRYVFKHYDRRDLAARLAAVLDGVGPRKEKWRAPKSKVSSAVKRLVDITVSALGLILLSPVFIAIAVLIKLDSPGPILFRQVRLGRRSRPFEVWKFRSMFAVSESAQRTGALSSDDPLITRIGRFLRATSLDELPQLINVLSGEMSLVGPRPAFLSHLERYDEDQIQRLSVRPGVTGWSQVNGRNEISWDQKIKGDLWYIANYSLLLDAKILLKTFGTVLSSRKVYGQSRSDDRWTGHEPRPGSTGSAKDQ